MAKYFLEQYFKIFNFKDFKNLSNKSNEEIKNILVNKIANSHYEKSLLSDFDITEEVYLDEKDLEKLELETNLENYDKEKSLINLCTIPKLQDFYFLDLSYKISKKDIEFFDDDSFFMKFYHGDYLENEELYASKIYSDEDLDYFLLTPKSIVVLYQDLLSSKLDKMADVVNEYVLKQNFQILLCKSI